MACQMKLLEIVKSFRISKEHVGQIVHEYFSKRKLCTKWIRCELTIDNILQIWPPADLRSQDNVRRKLIAKDKKIRTTKIL